MKLNMKRFMLSMAAVGMMILPGCASSNETKPEDTEQTETVTTSFANPTELLQAAWDKDDSADKPSIMGGMGEAYKEEEPYEVSLDDTDVVSSTFVIPVSVLEQTRSASSMMNAMMANHFSAICLEMKDGTDMQEAVDEISRQILSNHWLCGMPEVYSVVAKDHYIISCFGLSDTVNPFVDALKAELGSFDISVNGPIE